MNCPKCGCQVMDPFAGTILIHDVDRCGGKAPPAADVAPGRAEAEWDSATAAVLNNLTCALSAALHALKAPKETIDAMIDGDVEHIVCWINNPERERAHGEALVRAFVEGMKWFEDSRYGIGLMTNDLTEGFEEARRRLAAGTLGKP